MKRKLVLVFEDNQLLSASLVEHGKRSRLHPITTSNGAVGEIATALQSAVATIGKAANNSSTATTTATNPKIEPNSVPEACGLILEVPRSNPVEVAGVPVPVPVPVVETNLTAALTCVLEEIGHSPEISTSLISGEMRSKSVCARPKVAETTNSLFKSVLLKEVSTED